MNTKNKHIIWDIGNTLINFDHTHLKQRFGIESSNVNFLESDLMFMMFERGEISTKKWFEHFCNLYENISWDEYTKIMWHKTFSLNTKISKAFEFANRLSYSVLSNITIDVVVYLETKYSSVFNRIDHKFYSCLEGIAKPNHKIYELVLKKLNTEPQNCIFIDDRLEFLEPAKKLGINTFHYKYNNEELEDFLEI